jgi:hypothetical protein
MRKHDHSSGSNNSECFRTFIGCTVKGLLKNALPIGRPDLAAGCKTLVFECGWGLTIASNGSYWTESPEEIQRAIAIQKVRLAKTNHEIKHILELAGVK